MRTVMVQPQSPAPARRWRLRVSLAGMLAITAVIALICWSVSREYRHYNPDYDEEAKIAEKVLNCQGKAEWTLRPDEGIGLVNRNRCIELRRVMVDTRHCLDGAALLREVVTLKRMAWLSWDGDGAPDSLAGDVKLPLSVQFLTLNHTSYTWDEIAGFLEHAQGLRNLDLSYNPHLNFSKLRQLNCPRLESLGVSFTRFGLDNGLREACAIPTLRELDAYHTELDDRCIPFLIASPIQEITLGNNTKITQDGIAKLRAAGKKVM